MLKGNEAKREENEEWMQVWRANWLSSIYIEGKDNDELLHHPPSLLHVIVSARFGNHHVEKNMMFFLISAAENPPCKCAEGKLYKNKQRRAEDSTSSSERMETVVEEREKNSKVEEHLDCCVFNSEKNLSLIES